MKINFSLKFSSAQESPVRLSYNDKTFALADEDTLEIEQEIDLSPDDDTMARVPILDIQNLQEGIDARLQIDSFCINSVDVDQEEIQDFFSISLMGNRYSDDGVIEKVSEICFNGKLNLMVGENIRRFFWSPYYASRKRNDFVYDNRLACSMEGASHHWSIDERLGEKVYANIPHDSIDQDKVYELGCFGCSVTFGTGLEPTEVWPSLLTQDHLNLSVAGLGIDGIYLNLLNGLKKFNWRTTVIVLPNWERKILRFHLPSGEVTRVPTTLTGEWAHNHFKNWAWKTFNRQLSEKDRQRWKKIYQSNFQSLVNGKVEDYSKKALGMIVDLCEKADRPLYLTSWDQDTYDSLGSFIDSNRILPFFERVDEARDLAHHGPESHRKWADLSRSSLLKH
tara:strand:+ start:44 stop:1225 length:1182 start_codon:yes stop_codon:yes gene_type:complete